MKNFLTKTKANFRHNSKETHSKKLFLWVCGAFLALIVLKDILGAGTALVTSSLYSMRHYFLTSGATIPVFLQSRLELLDRIRLLEQNIASERGISTTHAYLTLENTELREMLLSSSTPRTVAGVVARPPYTPYDTVIIDRGSDDGITLHAPVYHGNSIALGYVRSVFPHTALVTLFSSPGVETTVYIYGANIFTTAYGEGGGVVRISVPQGILLEEGEPVVLPSLDTGILGVVRDIQSIPTEPEQHAYVTIDAPLQSIRLVSVGARAVEEATFDEAKAHVEAMEETLFTISVPESLRVFVTPAHEVATTSTTTLNDIHATSTQP